MACMPAHHGRTMKKLSVADLLLPLLLAVVTALFLLPQDTGDSKDSGYDRRVRAE